MISDRKRLEDIAGSLVLTNIKKEVQGKTLQVIMRFAPQICQISFNEN